MTAAYGPERQWLVTVARGGEHPFDVLAPHGPGPVGALDPVAAALLAEWRLPGCRAVKARRETHRGAAERTAFEATMVELARKRDAHAEAVKLRRFGRASPSWSPVPTEEWAHTLDAAGAETGYVARVRGRTLGEVAADIQKAFAALDDYADPLDAYCGAWYGAPEREADRRAGRFPEQSFDGEGLSVCSWAERGGKRGHEVEWPEGARWTACYAVTGSSEGHYAHVDVHVDRDGRREVVPAFICKTFLGFDHAWAIAEELARLLGA